VNGQNRLDRTALVKPNPPVTPGVLHGKTNGPLVALWSLGYTTGMKTAVSIPDTVFARTERFARRMKKSRSRIVSDALQEYLARHSPDEATEAMDRALDLIDEPPDSFVASATRRALEQVEW